MRTSFWSGAKSHLFFVLMIIIFALLGTKALFHSGLYSAHDIWHQVARLFHYTAAIRDGQLFPTWISQLAHGYGYPLFTFSYHLPWMIGAPFVLLGVSVENTIKVLFFLSFILSGFSMYWLSLCLTKDRVSSFVAAFAYMWAPYRFLTLFVSASIGTAFQFVVIPTLFAGAYLITSKRPRMGVVVLSFSIALSILSHLMTFIFIAPFLGIFAVFLILREPPKKRLRKFLLLGLSGILGLLLTSFYLIPLLSYTKSIIADNSGNGFTDIYLSNFVTLKQLVYSPWGYGPIVSNAKDGEISFSLGIIQWMGILLAIMVSAVGAFYKKTYGIINACILLFVVSVVGMLSLSEPLWELIQSKITLDYPFRLLAMGVFFSSLLIALAINTVKVPWFKFVLAFLIIVVGVYTNRNHVRVNMYTDFPLSLYIDSETTTNTFHEYLPKKANSSLLNEATKKPVIQPSDISVTNIFENTLQTTASIDLDQDSELVLRAFDFPGQQVYIDGQVTKHAVTGEGLISFQAPKGKHTISRVKEQTGIEQTGVILSLLAALVLARFIFSTKKKKI